MLLVNFVDCGDRIPLCPVHHAISTDRVQPAVLNLLEVHSFDASLHLKVRARCCVRQYRFRQSIHFATSRVAFSGYVSSGVIKGLFKSILPSTSAMRQITPTSSFIVPWNDFAHVPQIPIDYLQSIHTFTAILCFCFENVGSVFFDPNDVVQQCTFSDLDSYPRHRHSWQARHPMHCQSHPMHCQTLHDARHPMHC